MVDAMMMVVETVMVVVVVTNAMVTMTNVMMVVSSVTRSMPGAARSSPTSPTWHCPRVSYVAAVVVRIDQDNLVYNPPVLLPAEGAKARLGLVCLFRPRP